jgi:hypothetical protein
MTSGRAATLRKRGCSTATAHSWHCWSGSGRLPIEAISASPKLSAVVRMHSEPSADRRFLLADLVGTEPRERAQATPALTISVPRQLCIGRSTACNGRGRASWLRP